MGPGPSLPHCSISREENSRGWVSTLPLALPPVLEARIRMRVRTWEAQNRRLMSVGRSERRGGRRLREHWLLVMSKRRLWLLFEKNK